MDVRELLDGDSLDPKKLFDNKEYNTLILNRVGFDKSENAIADLLEELLDNSKTRPEKEEVFVALKKAKASEVMVSAIQQAEKNSHKAILTAACWECGLDFALDFYFFAQLACHNDFSVAMEALTVLSTIESQVPEDVLTKALVFVQNNKSQHEALMHDLIENIKARVPY